MYVEYRSDKEVGNLVALQRYFTWPTASCYAVLHYRVKAGLILPKSEAFEKR